MPSSGSISIVAAIIAEGKADYAKNANGVYACERSAHAKYREAKSEPETFATK